jgi:CubicO group peptidase (beta-lactamase class C family)
MRDMGLGVGAWICGLSLFGGAACGILPDELSQLGGHHPHEPPGHQAPPPAIDPRIDRSCLDHQLSPYVDAIGAGWPVAFRPTGSILVAGSGRALYSRGLGASDWDQGSPNTAETSFRVGSITKSFTAVAILQLAEAGLLAVGDTIGEHLPEYPAVGAGITIHELLSHTAGLPNYTENAELMARRDQPITPSELLASFWDQPLDFEPGTQFRYSNSGYVVLGAIIERVTGQTYAEYMQRAIFTPAGLARTTVGDAEGFPDRALGYTSDTLGRLVPAFPIDMSVPYAAGSIRSTALDLVRWHTVLSTDVLLGAESRELMTTPVLAGYAYGWDIGEQDGLQIVRHSGGIDGFVSDFIRVPELDLAIVVLLNAETVSPAAISNAALRCALGEDIPPEPPPPVVEIDAAQQQKVLGTYQLTVESRENLEGVGFTEDDLASLASVDVHEEEGALILEPIGQGPILLLPLSPTDFTLVGADATVHFSFADGEALPATALDIAQAGLTLSYER